MVVSSGGAVAAGYTSAGIYPGDPDANAIKLPGDFEAVIRPRMFYKNTDTLTGGEQEAWVIGGLAGLRSPWLADLFQFGAVGYISQKLSGPAGKGGTLLLQPDQSSIYVLGEAWGALRFAGQTITGYRQLIDRPFINTWDNREIPQTFEAYSLMGAAGALSYTGGYLTKVKTRGSEDFLWASQVAGAPGSDKGVIYAGATYTFANGGYIKLDEVYSTDVHNTFYIEGRYPFPFDDKTRLTLGAQYYPQKSVGDDLIGHFSTWGYGLNAALTYGAVTGQLYYTQTGKGFTIQSPYGDNPSYLNLQQIVFNTAGEKAWGIRGTVDFATLGVPGLTGYVLYASGKGPHQFVHRRAAAGSPRDRRPRRLRVRERDVGGGTGRDVPLLVAAPGRRGADADRPPRNSQLCGEVLTTGVVAGCRDDATISDRRRGMACPASFQSR
jgi:hypothetical protein